MKWWDGPKDMAVAVRRKGKMEALRNGRLLVAQFQPQTLIPRHNDRFYCRIIAYFVDRRANVTIHIES